MGREGNTIKDLTDRHLELVKHLTLGFDSSHNLRVVKWSPVPDLLEILSSPLPLQLP